MYRFYRARRVTPVIMVMVSLGVMFVMNGIVRLIIGFEDVVFADGERFRRQRRRFRFREATAWTKAWPSAPARRSRWSRQPWPWLRCSGSERTRTGKSMRAYSDNEDLALLSGINPDRVVAVTWIIVAALATIAGTLYGLDKSFKAFTYFQLLLPIFAAAIVGGLARPSGPLRVASSSPFPR